MDGIVISKVSKQYFDVKGNPFLALNQVSFEWRQGENLAVIGESGSGKSTLARLIIGLEKPTSGNIQINGEDIARWKFHRWRQERRRIQAVFQDASGTMDPAYSVYHNVEEALRNLSDAERKGTACPDRRADGTDAYEPQAPPGACSPVIRWGTASLIPAASLVSAPKLSHSGRGDQWVGFDFCRRRFVGVGEISYAIWMRISADYSR